MKFDPQFTFCSGDIADLFLTSPGAVGGNTLLVKKARLKVDNDLIVNEASILKDLMEKMLANSKAKNYSYAIPQLVGLNKEANLLEFFPGFLSVEDIRKVSTGIDGRTLVWSWKRLLGILSWVHHFRYVHGAVLPPHVMYFPDGSIKDERTHSVRLVDWCYAANYRKETKLKAWIPDYKDFYPPEVTDKKSLGPWTDLYMAAKTMIYFTGGDVVKNRFPGKIPVQLVSSIKKCLEPNYKKRAQSVTEIFDSFKATAGDVYGKPKFHDFKLAI